MKKRTFLVALGLAGLLVGGGLLASNMGFKLNYALDGPGVNGSATGTSTLGLPFHQQTNLANALDLINDMNAAGPGTVNSVSKFVKSTDGLLTYTGSAGENFSLVPGEAYFVQVAGTINYIVVGSHNPNLDVTFDGPGVNGSATGTTFFALPYHTTLTDALSLIAELNGAGPGTVNSVSKFVKSTDGLLTYTGSAGENFSLVPGEGYFVQVAGTIVARPSHY
jgi:hypothetical protein